MLNLIDLAILVWLVHNLEEEWGKWNFVEDSHSHCPFYHREKRCSRTSTWLHNKSVIDFGI